MNLKKLKALIQADLGLSFVKIGAIWGRSHLGTYIFWYHFIAIWGRTFFGTKLSHLNVIGENFTSFHYHQNAVAFCNLALSTHN